MLLNKKWLILTFFVIFFIISVQAKTTLYFNSTYLNITLPENFNEAPINVSHNNFWLSLDNKYLTFYFDNGYILYNQSVKIKTKNKIMLNKEIKYDLLDDINITYKGNKHKLKEMIIINKKIKLPNKFDNVNTLFIATNFDYDKKLKIRLGEDGNIYFYDNVMTRFIMPRPYVYDKMGNIAYLNYSITNNVILFEIPIYILNKFSYPIYIDPSVITGCTETATTIKCHDGDFSGEYINTYKNISVINATITGSLGGIYGQDNLVKLNTTNGWIIIKNSTLNAADGNDAGNIKLYSKKEINITNNSLLKIDSFGGGSNIYINSTSYIYVYNSFFKSYQTNPSINLNTKDNIYIYNSQLNCSSLSEYWTSGIDIKGNNILIKNSYLKNNGKNGDCANSDEEGGWGKIKLTSINNISLDGDKLYANGGNGCVYDSMHCSKGGNGRMYFYGKYLNFINNLTYLYLNGGNAKSGSNAYSDACVGGNSYLYLYSKYVTSNTSVIIDMESGDSSHGISTSETNKSQSIFSFYGKYINMSANITKTLGDGLIHTGLSLFKTYNLTDDNLDMKLIFRNGKIVGNTQTNISGIEWTLINYTWSGNGYFNITQDDGRVGAFWNSIRSAINMYYNGVKNQFIVNNTQGLNLAGLNYILRNWENYYSPINNPPTILFNGTTPTTILLNSTNNLINITLNDAEKDKINYVNFTLQYPDGNFYFNNISGTKVEGNTTLGVPEKWISDYFNITSTTESLGIWNWTIYFADNSSFGETQITKGFFTIVDTIYPKINLIYPSSNLIIYKNISVDLKYKLSDNVEISSCWYNLNNGNNITINNCSDNTTFSAPEGVYNITFYVNDTQGNTNYSKIYNVTLIYDNITPKINILNPTNPTSSKNFIIKVDVDDLGGAKYCIFNITQGASLEYSNTNLTYNSITTYWEHSVTVSSEATYVLNIKCVDYSDNINITNKTFDVSLNNEEGGGGGGGSTIIIGNEESQWSMEAEGGQSNYQINMIPGTSKNKDILFENLGSKVIHIRLKCVNIDSNICDYILIKDKEFDLPVLSGIKTTTSVTILIPKNFKKGKYKFNILAEDDNGYNGIITFDVNVGDFNFMISFLTKLTSLKNINGVNIPYFLIFMFLLITISIMSNFIILKPLKIPGGFSIFISLFISILIIYFV